ncbi:Chemotaxis protein methyltransferase [Burkholderiales bacterium]|nr:Chemotaxis protein methyltransferase [Burkholderiales bacterium]
MPLPPLAPTPPTLSRPEPREFKFSTQDFARVKTLIYQHAGISLTEAKQEMVYSRLARRLRALGHSGFDAYLDQLERNPRSPEWQSFVNALTTNLTSFFREAHHFPLLVEQAARNGRRPMVVWSAACSTGEEPYSIAMALVEHFGGFDAPVKVLATDIDTNVLATAREGVYREDALASVHAERLRRFFLKGKDGNTGFARIREELKALVDFRALNLLAPSWPLRAPLDAIFCRNVLIYFDKDTQYRVLQRFAPLLRSDGLLFIGHSESLFHAGDLFRLRGKTVYELAPGVSGGQGRSS